MIDNRKRLTSQAINFRQRPEPLLPPLIKSVVFRIEEILNTMFATSDIVGQMGRVAVADQVVVVVVIVVVLVVVVVGVAAELDELLSDVDFRLREIELLLILHLLAVQRFCFRHGFVFGS